MEILFAILLYGIPGALVPAVILLLIVWRNPRLMLQDYPKDVQSAVPPKTSAEKREAWYWAAVLFPLMIVFPVLAALSAKAAQLGFLGIFLSAYGVAFLFNVVDWLVLDWLIFCTLTPKWAVLPGTEGMAGYKDYAKHFKDFLIGTVLLLVVSVVIAGIVFVV